MIRDEITKKRINVLAVGSYVGDCYVVENYVATFRNFQTRDIAMLRGVAVAETIIVGDRPCIRID